MQIVTDTLTYASLIQFPILRNRTPLPDTPFPERILVTSSFLSLSRYAKLVDAAAQKECDAFFQDVGAKPWSKSKACGGSLALIRITCDLIHVHYSL